MPNSLNILWILPWQQTLTMVPGDGRFRVPIHNTREDHTGTLGNRDLMQWLGDLRRNYNREWRLMMNVMTWKCFPHYWLFVRGIHWVPLRGSVSGSFDIFLLLAWLDGWKSNLQFSTTKWLCMWSRFDCAIDQQNSREIVTKTCCPYGDTDVMLGIYSLIRTICQKVIWFYQNAVLIHIIFIVTPGEIFDHLGHTGTLTVNKMVLPLMYWQR